MITCAQTQLPPVNIAFNKHKTHSILAFNQEGKIDVFLFDDTKSLIKKLRLNESEYIPLTDWANANILYHVTQQLGLIPGESEANDTEIINQLQNALSDNIVNKSYVVTEICVSWNKIAKQTKNYAQFNQFNAKTPLEYQGAYELTLHDHLSQTFNIESWHYLQFAELMKSTLDGRAFSKNPYLQKMSLSDLGEACAKDIESFRETYEDIKKQLEQPKEWFTTVTGTVGFEIEDLLSDEEAKSNLTQVREVLIDLLARNIDNLKKVDDKILYFLAQTLPLAISPSDHPLYEKLAPDNAAEKPTEEQVRLAIEYVIEKNIRQCSFVLRPPAANSFYDILRLASSKEDQDKQRLLAILLSENCPLTPTELTAIIKKSNDLNIQDTAKTLLSKIPADFNKDIPLPTKQVVNHLSNAHLNKENLLPQKKYRFKIVKGYSWGPVVDSSHKFDDLKSLEAQVEHAANDIKGESYTHVKYNVLSLPEDFTKQYDTTHSENLMTALLGNKLLQDVQAPQWLFNDAQLARLADHMKIQRDAIKESKNKKNQQKREETFRQNTQTRFNVWSILSSTLVFGLIVKAMIGSAAAVPMLLIAKAVAGATIGAFLYNRAISCFFNIREHYLRRAEYTYNRDKVNELTEPAEIEALQIGVNATSVRNYAKSFFQLRAYTNYKAFLGGYSAAMQNKTEIVTEITKQRPR